MSATGAKQPELSSDIDFIKTPAAKPSEFATGEDCGIATTNVGFFEPLTSNLPRYSFANPLKVSSDQQSPLGC